MLVVGCVMLLDRGKALKMSLWCQSDVLCLSNSRGPEGLITNAWRFVVGVFEQAPFVLLSGLKDPS